MEDPWHDIDAALELDVELVRRHLTAWLRDQLQRAGFGRAVIGLSGGIDSSLSCFLTAEAIGAENVLALWIPYRTSNPVHFADARQVAEMLGVTLKTVEITPMVDPYLEQFPDMPARRRGNVMARARMIVLYDHSEIWQGLVVGSSNKTEWWLGYGTLYGDMACALNPLGDLYKTQVRQLARAMGVPAQIIAKPPTADLWPGQTDEGELGFTYADMDRALYLLIDCGLSTEEAVQRGLPPALVQGMWQRVQATEFKRRLPLVAKLPPEAFPRR